MSECHRLRVQALPAGDTIGKGGRGAGRRCHMPSHMSHGRCGGMTHVWTGPSRLILMPGIRSGAQGLLMMSRLSSQ